MANVAKMAPEVRDIHVPAPLRDLPLWCVWAYEQHPGEAKARKVPQYTAGGRRHGKQGSPEDLAKLTTFALARDAAARRGMDGVGFALTQEAGIVALDFDNCVADGVVDPIVANLVRNTYAEYSPSGKGVRAFFWGDLGNRKCFSKDHAFAVETFTSSGFVTVTGNMLPIVDLLGNEDRVATLPNEVEAYCLQRFGSAKPQVSSDPADVLDTFAPKIGLTLDESYDLLQQLDPDMPRHDWVRVAMALSHEYSHSEEAFDLWNDWSSYGSSYSSYENTRYQWNSLEGRRGFRPTTMASVIKMAKDVGARPSEAGSRKEVLAKAEAIMADLPKKSLGRFGPVPIYDLTQRPPMSWLIKGVLPKARLGVLFGASGSGKTFVALDLAFSIARGVAWRERRTGKGNVVIIAAEGGSGIGKRAEAYAQHYGFDLREVANLHVITAAPNFLDADDISEVLAEIKNLGVDIDLIIIDTLAQVTPGANENTSEDMGRALGNINLLHDATEAMNLVVHHAGKDLSKGSRGWSGLKAAADVQIEVLRHESGEREIVIEKMKDGEDGLRWGLKLEVIDLGIDLDGDPVTSCVAVPAEGVKRKEDADDRKGVKKRGRMENHVLEVMTLFDDRSVVPAHELIDKAVADLPEPEPGKRDIRRQSLVRAIHSLSREKDGPLKMENGKIFFFE
jgi:hypothetical protein